MSQISENVNVPRTVTQAAPAADLFRTKVHQGLGTSAKDPYIRTLPNQDSVPPESTVLASAAATAPTMEEVRTLSRKWGTMQYWLSDQFPRLPVYLESLLVPNAMPVSDTAEQLISQFESQIPSFLKDAKDHQTVQVLWRKAVEEYGSLSVTTVFNREEFSMRLQSLHDANLASARAVHSGSEVAMALEVLRRKAVLKRNRFIEDGLLPIVRNGPYLSFGHGVWRIFFEVVQRRKSDIFGKEENRILGFAWEALMQEDVVRTPSVSAPVALFLTLLSIREGALLVNDSVTDESKHVDDGVGRGAVKPSLQHTLRLVDPTVKRQFVMAELRKILDNASASKALSDALRRSGIHECSREAALCEAMSNTKELMTAEAESVSSRFDSTREVKSLLASLMAGTDEAARRHVADVLHVPLNGTHDWDVVLASVDWDANWRRLATALLADQATLSAMHTVVKNAIGSKRSMQRLFSKDCTEELGAVMAARDERVSAHRARIDSIVSELSSYQRVDTSLSLLKELGVSLSDLEAQAVILEKGFVTRRPAIDWKVLSLLVEAISQRHPSWVKARVLPSTASERSNPDRMLEHMVRMFIRLAYVPQTGAAKIAQHTRRRIGPIGLEPYQFNIAAEVGHVEQYDNLQYKRYDWQGWYQRMVDVHNRNVSIRCRIDDMKRLDSYGNPFVDMQTERRLRIISDNRVGMGVLKLDSDKFEDQSDNMTHGTNKLSEIIADSRKAQLGLEYWPTVEVKVRKPSGQSQAHYSVIDDERIERCSKELYEKYRDAKKRSLFVTPMDLWLEVKGMQTRKTADTADAQGYTVDDLHNSLSGDN